MVTQIIKRFNRLADKKVSIEIHISITNIVSSKPVRDI